MSYKVFSDMYIHVYDIYVYDIYDMYVLINQIKQFRRKLISLSSYNGYKFNSLLTCY